VPDVLHFLSHISFDFVNLELQNAYGRIQNYFHPLPHYKYDPKEVYSYKVFMPNFHLLKSHCFRPWENGCLCHSFTNFFQHWIAVGLHSRYLTKNFELLRFNELFTFARKVRSWLITNNVADTSAAMRRCSELG
jgi:hypothetical protein